MKHILKTGISVLILLTAVASLQAQGNLAQAGANFLQIGVEPRGAALGGAVIATTEGAAALYWNPAGIVSTKNMDLLFAYTNWYLDTKLAFGGITKNMGSWGTIGFSATSLYMDKMEITTVYESEGTGNYYEAGDIALGLSYARNLTDRFTFGVTAKYVQEYIWNESASQLALDVGSLYRADFYNLRIGMAIHNFSGTLKFKGDDVDRRIEEEMAQDEDRNPRLERFTPEFRLPQVFHMGIAFDPICFSSGHLTIMTSVDAPSDNEQRLLYGIEYGFRDLAFLRISYRDNYDTGNFAFGAGLNLPLMGLNSNLDYAFSAHGDLGDVHRFALGLSF